MQKLCLMAVGLLFALPLGAAEPVHHPERQTHQLVKPDDQQVQTHLRHMDEQLKLMHAQLVRLNATTEPQQRQKLGNEHMESLRTGMRMLAEMPGCPLMSGAKPGMPGAEMMGGCMMMSGQMGPMSSHKAQDARQAKALDSNVKPAMPCRSCQQMMLMRMQMMQAVLEGLLAHQE